MPKKQKKWVLRAAELLLSISVVFCFWGIFDCVNWAVLYGAPPILMPVLYDTRSEQNPTC